MRVINRAWASVAAASHDGSIAHALRGDEVFRNATRFALLLGEHTWGEKSPLPPRLDPLFHNYR